MITYKEGDLLKAALAGDVHVIMHQCNCFNTFGSGIAKQIKMVFPEAFDADLETKKGDVAKLGTYTVAASRGILIYNLYGQYGVSATNMQTRYDALEDAMSSVSELIAHTVIGIPRIGCGLGGGDWSIVEDIVERTIARNNEVIVYDYKP